MHERASNMITVPEGFGTSHNARQDQDVLALIAAMAVAAGENGREEFTFARAADLCRQHGLLRWITRYGAEIPDEDTGANRFQLTQSANSRLGKILAPFFPGGLPRLINIGGRAVQTFAKGAQRHRRLIIET